MKKVKKYFNFRSELQQNKLCFHDNFNLHLKCNILSCGQNRGRCTVMKQVKKPVFLDQKCSIRSCIFMRISTRTSTQNLLESLKNLGYLSFSTTAPYFQNIKIYNFCSHYNCSIICIHMVY